METIPKQEAADTILSEWQEPQRERVEITAKSRSLIIAAAALAAVALIGLGIWLKSFSYYLGAVVAIVAAASTLIQNKGKEKSRKITLTRQWLVIDGKQYALANFSGFWMERDGDHLVINVESKKATLVPVTFFYSTLNTNQARQLITQVLPEVEPRYDQLNSINRYFRF